MENSLIIIELNNGRFISIDCLSFTIPTINANTLEMEIKTNLVYFSDIQAIINEKFQLHMYRVCFNGCIIKSIDYYNNYLTISLYIDHYINHDQINTFFIKTNRKLKISNLFKLM